MSDLEYTYDWATPHFASWSELFSPIRDSTEAVLEIGSFEGRSAVFFLSYFKNASIVCVDTFEGSVEHRAPDARFPADMEAVEKRFDSNLRAFGERVRKFKGASIVVLDQLNRVGQRFDLAYVDGDHAAASVFSDAALAWRLLRPGGILILDDYGFMPSWPPERRPDPGIDAFLNLIGGEFEELERGSQVIVRKLDVTAAPAVTAKREPYLPVAGLSPPLVSFVVISWNYARFISDTIKSIRNQDYPNFECIVIDNNSADDSRTAIEDSITGDERFRSIYLPENLGQLGAALWALDKLKGSYVVFVDSDDVIFTNFASMHLQAHLGFSPPVAITTSAIAEMDASGRVIQFRDYRARIKANAESLGLRPIDDLMRLPTVSENEYRRLSALCARVPTTADGWIWSPGTANMFRRSALELARMGDGNQKFLRPADGHFNRLCHLLVGTGIVNLVLSAYRLHGGNAFALHEELEGIRKGKLEERWFSKDDTVETIRHILKEKEFYAKKVGRRYLKILGSYIRSIGGERDTPSFRALVGGHIGPMQEIFGATATAKAVIGWFGPFRGLEILYRARALHSRQRADRKAD